MINYSQMNNEVMMANSHAISTPLAEKNKSYNKLSGRINTEANCSMNYDEHPSELQVIFGFYRRIVLLLNLR